MISKKIVVQLQHAMNLAGASPKLTEDGDPGPKTTAMSEEFDFLITAKKKQPAAPPPVSILPPLGEYFGAQWVGANIDLLGRSETDPVLNARYVPEWKKEGLNYDTLAGNTHPWCSVSHNADKRKVGAPTTDSAGASSWSSYGLECPYWFGASLPIRHKSGGRHITTFLYWIDEKNRIAACYGGNQSNHLSIAATNLSGNAKGHDEVWHSPRWPKGWPAGQLVSKEEVLAKYPFLKVGGSMASTR